jgi:putative aldouronate transport system permease protein
LQDLRHLRRNRTANYLRRYWTLYLLLALPVAFIIIFRYIPMAYILNAFKVNNILSPPWRLPWARNNGFEWFIKAFSNRDFLFALRNTITLNLLDLLLGFPAPILLALLLNELTFKRFKRITQTIVYLPHFLSWIIISGLALRLLALNDGLVNILLQRIGLNPVPFLNSPSYWVASYVTLGIWKEAGWNTIIYLAAMTAINPELYEAAAVDGASRLRRIWHVTMPGLRPTIVILLIMSLGRILGSEFDRPFALGNRMVRSVYNTISIFVYEYGIKGMQFSLSSAVGLFQSVVGVIFLFGANSIARRNDEQGVW